MHGAGVVDLQAVERAAVVGRGGDVEERVELLRDLARGDAAGHFGAPSAGGSGAWNVPAIMRVRTESMAARVAAGMVASSRGL